MIYVEETGDILGSTDIFEDFNGNHAKKEKLLTYFKHYKNCDYAEDWYEEYNNMKKVDIE